MIDNFIDIFPSFNLVKGGDKNRFFSYCQQFNNLQNQLRVIHVVGTNGKGSVSNYLATMLKNNGYHTGLFISPSYQYHNERIQCNNIAITDQQLLHYLNTIHQKISFQPINFFELFFLVALHYFVDQKCEICVLEAGIGGQFDPTSVCTNAWFNVLTSVSYDHQDLLGTTIPQIINQKMLVAPNNQKFFIAPSNYQYHQIINSYPNPKIWVNLQKFSHNYFLNESASIVTTIANHHQLTPNVN